ncbi:MAG: hypothetical protein AB1728_12930 [Bacteroidota bacterium]
MKLTFNETRNNNKYLESVKYLPDHCRFLLFGDTQEAVLVWNGKQTESAILSFHSRLQSREKNQEQKTYGFIHEK